MKGHNEEMNFIIYTSNPVGGSIRITKRHKGKTRIDKNKRNKIAGTAARLAGMKIPSKAARVT